MAIPNHMHRAVLLTSAEWPKHWQRVIAKITRQYQTLEDRYVIWVRALNPEYLKYMNDREARADDYLGRMPPRYLDGVLEFETVEDLDAWARVTDRITNS